MDNLQDNELTFSEAEVWCLKQAGPNYQAIAEQLPLTETPAKKPVNSVNNVQANVQAQPTAEQSELPSFSQGLLDVGFWINLSE